MLSCISPISLPISTETDMNINIVIHGPVSAGKSTAINAFLQNCLSDMKIARTTTCPQIYRLINKISDKPLTPSEVKAIHTKNNKRNKSLRQGNYGESLKSEDLIEAVYSIPTPKGLFNVDKDVNIILHDMPGLNDGSAKEIYYAYMKRNFHQYDIVIFMVDIHSALNTSDEVEILDVLLQGIKTNKDNGITTRLIVLINKCDEMKIGNISPGKTELIDKELQDMENQIHVIVTSKISQYFSTHENFYEFVKFSGEDTYIYRMLQNNSVDNLSDKYKDKFGINEVGKKAWTRASPEKKRKILQGKLRILNYEECYDLTGFTSLQWVFNRMLIPKRQLEYLVNKITIKMKEIKVPSSISIDTELNCFKTFEIAIRELSKKFECNEAKTTWAPRKIFIKFIREYVEKHNKYFTTKYYDADILDNKYFESFRQFGEGIETLLEVDQMFSRGCLIFTVHDSKFLRERRYRLQKNIQTYYKCLLVYKNNSAEIIKECIDTLIKYEYSREELMMHPIWSNLILQFSSVTSVKLLKYYKETFEDESHNINSSELIFINIKKFLGNFIGDEFLDTSHGKAILAKIDALHKLIIGHIEDNMGDYYLANVYAWPKELRFINEFCTYAKYTVYKTMDRFDSNHVLSSLNHILEDNQEHKWPLIEYYLEQF